MAHQHTIAMEVTRDTERKKRQQIEDGKFCQKKIEDFQKWNGGAIL